MQRELVDNYCTCTNYKSKSAIEEIVYVMPSLLSLSGRAESNIELRNVSFKANFTLNVKPSLSFTKNINGWLLHNDFLVTLLICTHIWTSSYFTTKDLRSFHIFSMPLKFNLYCAIFRVEIYKSKNKYEVNLTSLNFIYFDIKKHH